MRSFVKLKPSRNVKITLSFTDIGISCPSREFPVWSRIVFYPEFGVLVWSSEKGPGRTLVRSSGSEFRERVWPNPGSAGSEFGERTGPNPGSAGSELGERNGPKPGLAGSEFGEKTGLNPDSAGSVFGERNGLNPGLAGSEFGERTWPNPDSEFGFGVLRKERAETWFGRFGEKTLCLSFFSFTLFFHFFKSFFFSFFFFLFFFLFFFSYFFSFFFFSSEFGERRKELAFLQTPNLPN